MATKDDKAPEREPAARDPIAYEVRESFVIDVDGVPVAYRRGEPIHPDDPIRKRHGANIGPLTFPHPIHRRGTLGTPEVRAE